MRMEPVLVLVGSLLLLAGCLALGNDEAEQNPEFAAWLEEDPSDRKLFYQGIGGGFVVNVKNVQPKKTVQTPGGTTEIGEAGTHTVCSESSYEVLTCKNVSLIPGQVKQVHLGVSSDARLGQYNVTILNETVPVEVRPLPEPGDWINGTLVDMQLAEVHQVENETWHWSVKVHYHNGSIPVSVGVDFGTVERGVDYDGHRTVQNWTSDTIRPVQGFPVTASVHTQEQLPWREHPFVWSHPKGLDVE